MTKRPKHGFVNLDIPIVTVIKSKKEKEDLKQKLHQIISTENTQHPYSDAQLTEILSQYCGRPLSRRLIQKYRTLLHIANSYERRY